MPAARAAVTPGTLSSMTRQASGTAPMVAAAWRKRSGAGLPRATMVEEKMRPSKSGSRPVSPREWRRRTGSLLDATQDGRSRAVTASATPAMARSSASKARSVSSFTASTKPSGATTP